MSLFDFQRAQFEAVAVRQGQRVANREGTGVGEQGAGGSQSRCSHFEGGQSGGVRVDSVRDVEVLVTVDGQLTAGVVKFGAYTGNVVEAVNQILNGRTSGHRVGTGDDGVRGVDRVNEFQGGRGRDHVGVGQSRAGVQRRGAVGQRDGRLAALEGEGGGCALAFRQIREVQTGGQGRVGVVDRVDRQLGRGVFVEDRGQVVAVASQQVLALVAGVFRQILDLGQKFVVLGRKLLALVLALGLKGLVGFRLGGLDQLGDAGDAFIRSFQGLNRLAHVVQKSGQVVCTGSQAGSREEAVRIVQSRVHFLTGRQFVLDVGHERCGLLESV